jgi:hypothetical protein
MEKNVEFGINYIKFAPLAANGVFPDFTASTAVSVDMIVVDSFTHTEEDNTFQEIEWEDIAQKLTLPGSMGKKTITFTSNNVSAEAYKFFKGYSDGTGDNAGYLVNDPNFDDSQNLAMQYVTLPVAQYDAFEHEFTPVLVTVKKTGNTGKNGLPALQFTCTFQPNFDAAGKSIPNHRYKTA